ncbi:hypothetical protein GCM10010431_85650 [Streptomyces kunmingensis]
MSAQTRPGWMEKPKPITQVGKVIALVAVVALVCVPFLTIVATSLASPRDVVDNGGWVCGPSTPPSAPTATSWTAASSPTPWG